ncbi:DNA/RNA non-specific endonuclease [Chryseobacterium sp. CFS15]|uniref:DNA/RNA non-specific endonuclease n=1 Tax=Chryseobacterium sp. CFS15 TaxID=2986946 RepID=UPI002807CD08|nr:DNA/RNA non-specific endonuclease [Chryseobacterium sp. CFS15]MDQ8144424.1 DNA/RNA non-specific endonuclease [Chryseobacterium sp. CFS15]
MKGYNNFFLGENFQLDLPEYDYYKNDIALNNVTGKEELDYTYYSVIQSKSRRVPILSASNIFRIKFEKALREGDFKEDDRVKENEQLASKDYSNFNSIKAKSIDKGHMTKREDVQWDLNGDVEAAVNAAISTFFYPNAAPQHGQMNKGPWKNLENSVIIKGRVPEPAKVSVFTGPVLDAEDPEYKSTLKDGSIFKIPILFWKIIYYTKEDNLLYRAGFLMSQINLLRRDNLINEIAFREFGLVDRPTSLKPFLDFKEDENYQVPVSMIEKLTNLQFTPALDRHENVQPTILKLEQVQIRDFDKSLEGNVSEYEVTGLMV